SPTGWLKIEKVDSCGHFIRLLNFSPDRNLDLSGYFIQQTIGRHPVSLYRFPRRSWLPARQHITVWAADSKVGPPQPTDFLWDELPRFRAGPECTTLLCSPSGRVSCGHRNLQQTYSHNDDVLFLTLNLLHVFY
ncbi:LMTD1 protein, partial [Polypterus senegalus]|nr:LMTD1 protein [Polypterus senegalus]